MKLKKRADQLLFENNLTESRSKAQALILAGSVEYLSPKGLWVKLQKAGELFSTETTFKITDATLKDVSRGATKLRAVFDEWPFLTEQVKDASALDIGSSTGGFTQVLLEKGAAHVVALDVGTHQLHERLRKDPRVLSLEKTHVLKIDEGFWKHQKELSYPFGVFVMDVSFISSNKVLFHAHPWLKAGGHWVLLVKPQFELEPSKLRKGIVKSEEFRQEALLSVVNFANKLGCFNVKGYCESPIAGMDGNKEFLLCLEKLR
jgi:23S rRNA (cytidine1920-2'-O)/16S rRNA (cytidine1409-2'-O)-methyltransferase